MTAVAIPAHMLPHRTPDQLLAMARRGLEEAAHTRSDGLRYAAGHLAALRAAAAILATRAEPDRPTAGRHPRTMWDLLTQVEPEMTEWAAYFADTTTKRAAAEAGIPRVVAATEADDMLRQAGMFVDVAETTVGR